MVISSSNISKFLPINELNSEELTPQVWLAVRSFWIPYAVNPRFFAEQLS